MIDTRRPQLPPDFDPYAAQPESGHAPRESTAVPDVSTASAWGFWGVSLAQLNEILQSIALVLTIIATTITIGVHMRRWFAKRGWDAGK